MKITKTKTAPPPPPVTVRIEMTESDYQLLQRLMSYDLTIPKTLRAAGCPEVDEIRGMMGRFITSKHEEEGQ